ncbi:MAG: hypothetical protein HY435_03010 [Candidatus Liptonbacteria bacterium]|nr:hypothetical protein [Candidatus Liptonbacteria bacterium]
MGKEEAITFVVFARDESRRIPYLLRNLGGYGGVLVMLDDRTRDDTAAEARKFGARVELFQHPGWTEGAETVALVEKLAKTDWLYWAYVDELLTKSLLEKMAMLSRQDNYRAVWMWRKNYNYGGVKLDDGYTLRFFKKGAIDFMGNQIGRFGKIAVPEDQVLYLPRGEKYAVHHFSTYDVSKFEAAHGKYSTEEAKANLRLGRHFSGLKLVGKPIYFFLKYMIVGGAWRWGWRGLIITAQYCFYFFNIQAKMWEIENNVTVESMEKTYDSMKDKLLSDFDEEKK